MSKEWDRPIEDAGSSPGGAVSTSGESPTGEIGREKRRRALVRRCAAAAAAAVTVGLAAFGVRDYYYREGRPTPTEKVTPLPLPSTPTGVIIYPPPTATPEPPREALPTPTEPIPTPGTDRETREPGEPTATPTPEVSAIPENLFPNYGTMLGFDDNRSAGLMITRLPDGSGYLVFFANNTSGLDNVGVYGIVSSPEPGVYKLEQQGGRISDVRRKGVMEVRFYEGGKPIEVEFTLLPPTAHPQRPPQVFNLSLTFQGRGKKAAQDAIREIGLEIEHSGPWSDQIITELLRSNKVTLP